MGRVLFAAPTCRTAHCVARRRQRRRPQVTQCVRALWLNCFRVLKFCRFVTAAPVRERKAHKQQGSQAPDHRIRPSISKPAQNWQDQRAYKGEKRASSSVIATTALHFQGGAKPPASDAGLKQRQVHQPSQAAHADAYPQQASFGAQSKWGKFSEQKQQQQQQQQQQPSSSKWGAFVDSQVTSHSICIRDDDDGAFATCFD
jgi:hypothetical protein